MRLATLPSTASSTGLTALALSRLTLPSAVSPYRNQHGALIAADDAVVAAARAVDFRLVDVGSEGRQRGCERARQQATAQSAPGAIRH